MDFVLVLFVLIAMPIMSYFEVERQKKLRDDRAREFFYLRIYIWYILTTVVSLYISPFQTIFYDRHVFVLPNVINVCMWLLVAYQALMLLLPMVMVKHSEVLRDKVTEQYAKKDHIFPSTNRHQLMFMFVAIVVGISEEIIFRGFMFNFAIHHGLSAILSFLVVSIIFGLGHWQQGRGAIVDTMLFGLSMGFIYNVTGNLLIPILWHILLDAKVLFITRLLQAQKSL